MSCSTESAKTLADELEGVEEQLRVTRSVVTLANLAVNAAEDTGETENMSIIRQSLEHAIERMTTIEATVSRLWAQQIEQVRS